MKSHQEKFFILPLYKHFGGGVRVCGDAFYSILVWLSFDIAVLQNQAVSGI